MAGSVGVAVANRLAPERSRFSRIVALLVLAFCAALVVALLAGVLFLVWNVIGFVPYLPIWSLCLISLAAGLMWLVARARRTPLADLADLNSGVVWSGELLKSVSAQQAQPDDRQD